MPAVSNTDGQSTIMIPLILVIAASAMKDLFEDRKRHAQDLVENRRKVFRADPVNSVYT